MIRRLPPCFAGTSAHWVDEGGAPLFNDRGELVTDDDVYRSEYFTELDRLNLDLCNHERAAGKKQPDWLLKLELASFQRQRSAAREVT